MGGGGESPLAEGCLQQLARGLSLRQTIQGQVSHLQSALGIRPKDAPYGKGKQVSEQCRNVPRTVQVRSSTGELESESLLPLTFLAGPRPRKQLRPIGLRVAPGQMAHVG